MSVAGIVWHSARFIQAGIALGLQPGDGVVLRTQTPTAAEIGRAALMPSHHHVDAPGLQGRDHPVRAKEPVGQDDVAGLEPFEQRPEQDQFAGLLALIGSHGGLEHRAHGQAEHDQEAENREPQSGRLGLELGVRRLVRRRVGNDHSGAVDDLHRAAVKQPSPVRLLMNRSPGLSNQFPGDVLGQALAGLAVAGGGGGDRGEPLVAAVFLEAVDGIVTGVVVGEDLGEEQVQGDPRGVDPLPPGVIPAAAARFDRRPREEFEEGETLLGSCPGIGKLLLPRGVSQKSHGG